MGDIDAVENPVGDRLAGLRILLIAPSLRNLGGQSVQAELLLRNLRGEGAEIGFLPIDPVPPGPLKYLSRIKYCRTAIVTLFYVGSLLRQMRRCDVVHIFSASYLSFLISPSPALLVARLFGRRSILHYHSGEADDHLRGSGRIVRWLLRQAGRIVVPSDYLANVFAEFGFPAIVVNNIAASSDFVWRTRTVLQPNILVARNLESLYDIPTAIRAFASVKRAYPHATLTVTGSGSNRTKLEQQVEIAGLTNVSFTGRVDRQDMSRLMREADILLNSSIIDNAPVSIIEAFASGLPVVTTNAGGIPYLVRHDVNGLLTETGDAEALAACIIRLLEDADLVTRLTAAARESAEKWNWSRVGPRWADVYCGNLP